MRTSRRAGTAASARSAVAGRRTGAGRRARRLRLAASLLPLLLLGACGAGGPDAAPADPEPPSPFADCAALADPPTAADAATAADAPTGAAPATVGKAANGGDGAAASERRPMPEIRLPCFTGGQTVALDALRGPAVINLWASWCQPCRKELPAFQRLAERTAGRLHVVGVDTRDRRESARSLGEDLGLSFPSLVDRDELLRAELGRAALPVTLLLDGEGRIRHLDDTGALDDGALAGLVQRHLGVTAAP